MCSEISFVDDVSYSRNFSEESAKKEKNQTKGHIVQLLEFFYMYSIVSVQS